MGTSYKIKAVLLFLQLINFLGGCDAATWGTYDFIVVGAGTSGSALAAKLSQNKNWKILLLEAGDKPSYLTQIPYFSVGPFRGEYDWGFFTEKQIHGFQQYEDQKTYLPFGKGLGGTSIINGLICTRGNAEDYNNWASMRNEGWSYEEVLKYFKNLETFQGPMIGQDDVEYHNIGGPVFISQPPYKTKIAETFINACQSLGFSEIDYNGATQIGCANPYFCLYKGTRWSTYEAYLRPIQNRTNIEIVTNAYVTQLITDGHRKAVGVRFETDGNRWTASAKKEIILSAGAVKTPHILMLSGIGNSAELTKHGIPIQINLPGVGQNLLDHITVLGMTFTVPPDIGFSFRTDVTPETLELWEKKRLGPLTVPFRSEGIGFFMTPKSKHAEFPDFELLLLQPPGSYLGLNKEASDAAFKPENASDETLIVFPILLQPESVGSLTLKSNSPYDQPIIQPNYLSHIADVETLREAIKFTIQLMETEEFLNLGVKRLKRQLPGCESYTLDTDEYYDCQIHHYTSSVFHFMGSSKMGPATDDFAVVDYRLRVHGATGLRIADTSIIPSTISGHPMLPAIMIGEKAAAMIIEEWETKKVPHTEL